VPNQLLLWQSVAVAANRGLGLARTAALASMLGPRATLDVYFAIQVLFGLTAIAYADQMEVAATRSVALSTRDSANGTTGSHWLRLISSVAVVATIVAVTTPPFVHRYVPASADVQRTIGQSQVALWLCIVSYVPYRILAGMSRGRGRHRDVIFAELAQGILFFAISILLVWLSPATDPVFSMLLAQACGSIAGIGVLAALVGSDNRTSRMALPADVGRIGAQLYGVGLVLFGFTLLDRFLAGQAGVGALSALTLASTLSMTLRSLVAFEPILTADWIRSAPGSDALKNAVDTVTHFALPVIFFLIAGGGPLVTLGLEHGRFEARDTALVASVLRVYGWATWIFMVSALTQRVLMLSADIRGLLLTNVLGLSFAVLIGVPTARAFGPAGAVFGTLVGQLVVVVLQVQRLRSLIGENIAPELARGCAVVAGTMLVAELARVAVTRSEASVVLQLLSAGVAALIIWLFQGARAKTAERRL
jgi:peptidoglycan biosynthesis protein MviN/MurJ (putative lipid II flippase)